MVMDLLDRLVEANINAASKRGVFDNLAGAGQPQNLDEDNGVPESLRAGYRLLKNAGFVPPEIQTRREIDSIDQLLRAATSDDAESRRLFKRRQWLELRLAESSRGRALLADREYGAQLRDRLTTAPPGTADHS